MLTRVRRMQIPETQANTGDNHSISAMKFEIIHEFLKLGWNVLLRCGRAAAGGSVVAVRI